MENSKIIANQNDNFRMSIMGETNINTPKGKTVMTQGVSSLSPDILLELTHKVATFDDFTVEADPYKFHEMGVIKISDITIWFKIDLYDENYEGGSEEPENPEKTRRVLTMLLPSEY